MCSFEIISEIEKKFVELELSYQCHPDGSYLLRNSNEVASTIKVRLLFSGKTDESVHGSRNGNIIQSISIFKFRRSEVEDETDFFILGFCSSQDRRPDFVIIPTEELKRRLFKKKFNSAGNRNVTVIFWLMPDNHLYEATGLGIEGEWYFMSEGANGRMADCTVWDYSEFLNDWGKLK